MHVWLSSTHDWMWIEMVSSFHFVYSGTVFPSVPAFQAGGPSNAQMSQCLGSEGINYVFV